MKRNLIALIVIAALTITACAAAAQPQVYTEPSYDASTGLAGGAYAPEAPAAEAPSVAAAPVEGDVSLAPGAERLVIKNANLSIVVDDTAVTVDKITQMAEGLGGFVVTLNTYQTTYGADYALAQHATMTIRVPSAKLNDALKQIKDLSVDVTSESISGQDVTSEYVDLKSRLTNLEAAEKQLQSIMAEATKTEDVLAVYNQLVYTREQIEVIKGQIKYYEEAAALSAISVDITPNVATQPISIGGWHPEGTAKDALETLVRALQDLADGLIYFGIVCLPFLLIAGVPLFFFGRWLWKRRKKNTPAPSN
ncbi:MAG: DUF4349 domain-containing protein [Chloroflexota bacterium]